MSELTVNKIEFLVALISEFADRFHLSNDEAYKYISSHGGVEMFEEHYGILHTLSFRDMVDGMAAFCRRQGGLLA